MDIELSKEISKIINSDAPERHSFFQLNFMVLGKEPTHQAKLLKCIKELRMRNESHESLRLEIDERLDRNELMHIAMSKVKSKNQKEFQIKARIVERKIYKNNKQIDSLKKRMKNIEEEMLFFAQAFKTLSEKEELKSWDDMDVQKQYWNAKLQEDINYRVLVGLPIDIEVMKTALALPEDVQVKINLLDRIKSIENKLLKSNER